MTSAPHPDRRPIASRSTAWAKWLGWATALLAALTAYVRVFGGALGLAQDFAGIMAKQRRMAALNVAANTQR